MTSQLVSVTIPAYNNAEYLGDAIQSVLQQTYQNFEIIIVNDASPDHTEDIVDRFNDSRIKYILHEKNRGLSEARNSGIINSSGEFIAFLDGDDYFHPEKLEAHIEFFKGHPEIGATYNSRFNLNYSSNTIRELNCPPLTVSLADLVLGFPFAPSDMVLRREWPFLVGLFDSSYTFFGEELDFNCKLALAGCKFASVDRALNYRRYHSGRIVRNLRACQEEETRPLCTTFSDPRCPPEVLALRDLAFSNRYLGWMNVAFTQNATALGQEYCLEAIRLNPSLIEGVPCELLRHLIAESIADESTDHQEMLRRFFDQLPVELRWLEKHFDWSVARGYLLLATRAIIWGRFEQAAKYFAHAVASGAQTDDLYFQDVTHDLMQFEAEYGIDSTQDIIRKLTNHIEKIGGRAAASELKGICSINRAFTLYRSGRNASVPGEILRAIAANPKYLRNRGVLAVLLRSLLSSGQGRSLELAATGEHA